MHFCVAHWIARHSSSIVAYRCCVGVNEHEPQCTRERDLSSRCWTRQYPIPYNLDASVRSIVGMSGSNGCTVVLFVSISFIFRKSSSCSGSHCQAVSFVSSFRILASMWLRSGMKDPSCTASPQNARRDLMSVGRGKFFYCIVLLIVWPDSCRRDHMPCKFHSFAYLEFFLRDCDVEISASIKDESYSLL